MNLNLGRRDRRTQEMSSSSLPASLFLLSVVFWQFVAAAGQNIITIKAEPGDDRILPCKAPEQEQIVAIEWGRTDLGPEAVLLYRDHQFDPTNQHQSYKDRVDLLVSQVQKRDASLILQNARTNDSGTYECRVKQANHEKKLISTVSLVVAPRPAEPFPVWVIVLLVLLVLLGLVAAALYFLFHWSPVQQVEVESGEKFVLLPLKVPRCLWVCKYRRSVDKVEWKDEDDKTVHVYQNGSDQPGEQNQIYKDRTKMDENLLETKDLSLTLEWPRYGDSKIFTCSVYNRNGDKLMKKDVWLKVKVPKVEVKSGKESVLLPWKTTESLDGDVKVEWKDEDNRKVHVYQNGSDQSGEQNQIYRTRTKMDENLLKNKNLSLTLRRPRDEDRGFYTCRVSNRDGDMLMMKQVLLWVKVPKVVVEPGKESVLLPWRITESLDGDVKVEWKDKDDRTVHVYQNGSDQLGEQDQIYRTRTRMDEDPLRTGDLSLTLLWPIFKDEGIYTCSVLRDGDMLMEKRVLLWVKVPKVEVESEKESVLLPWTITESLDGGVKVEWKDKDNKKVHVYQNGSDQPGEQNQKYRTRTKMDGNALKNKNLSLTLTCPTFRDTGTYTCSVYNRDGDMLMEKQVQLWVKGRFQVQSETPNQRTPGPEDTRTRSNSIDPSPLMGDQLV